MYTAKNFLFENLSKNIISFDLDEDEGRLRLELDDNSLLYIYYNNYNEYSYHIQFSAVKLDRVRFDSMDKKWEVHTRPHHFHPRNKKEGISSPMCGDPDKDMPLLINLIKSNELKNHKLFFNHK